MRLSGQPLAAVVALALLAIVAVVTAPAGTSDGATYASTDYHGGGYRAWAALLAHEGIRTSRFILRPVELNDRIDTLVSAAPLPSVADPDARTAADLASLATWVRAGGQLVYIGRQAALGAVETQLLDLPYFLPDVGARGRLSGPLAGVVPVLQQLGSNRMLLIEHRGRSELADGNGDIVVRYPFGRGDIVAVSDTLPFTNANIASAANARLAYLVALPRRAGGLVAFDDGLHGALIDRPWYRALPAPVKLGVGILALAAMLALGAGALRSGPPIRLRPPREPTSAEFVQALGALYERVGARSKAATILAHDALATAAQAHGLSDRASPPEILARIGEAPNAADVRRLAQTLNIPIATDAELIASAKLARTVRKEWTHDGYGDRRRAAFAGRARTRDRR